MCHECCYCCLLYFVMFHCFFKQKTAYEMRISDWSSDVCSSDLSVEELEELLDDRLFLMRTGIERRRRGEIIPAGDFDAGMVTMARIRALVAADRTSVV